MDDGKSLRILFEGEKQSYEKADRCFPFNRKTLLKWNRFPSPYNALYA